MQELRQRIMELLEEKIYPRIVVVASKPAISEEYNIERRISIGITMVPSNAMPHMTQDQLVELLLVILRTRIKEALECDQ